ncbi:GNAT family N-acetyltransferase [Paenibacillus sp. SC116]|uniref:GNAT family N-acetyltransferase n=1 Tax=Paenibacillus sp. SC116 TaxID=2968986 RepID=UPI00215B0054|nr:GNAT family N-acetyltransferase [Paenibacillus sp. SC116]MCR8843462.1 GNAT family N-acetyltransferase [Paenibacillus sp. SC116]
MTMTNIRILNDKEMHEAILLADRIFRDAEQVSMATGFPYLYATTYSQSFGTYEGDRLVGFNGLLPAVLRIGPAAVNVFSLGSVCIDPEARGRGYASSMLDHVKEHVKQAGASLLLVTGTRSLYTRAACHLFGAVTRVMLDQSHAQSILASQDSQPFHLRTMEPYEWLKLHAVARGRHVRYEQSVWDWVGLVKAEAYASCVKLTHQVLVAERDGKIAACAVVAIPKGTLKSRRPPFAVEWAGDASAVACLLAYATVNNNLPVLEVPVNWHENELSEIFNSIPSISEQNLGTVYMADIEQFVEEIRPYWLQHDATVGAQLNIRLADQDKNEDEYELSIPQLSPLRLSGQQLTALLFTPHTQLDLPSGWAAALQPILPIPLPSTSGLNYI